ncbi:hypothetical protein PS918_01095 [Pseudomonas fluorescens]|uniref:Uncharacterized protein n=1 Tax=Pseudomonas fluorescens TaxID=294 RepID=A0A5E7RAE6_PSEFL|nr:hypothetical protein [Pseudomonas fluorescens]VVP70934.1 hypothetical protein PS918_01095 [Pseudomonas fluorescens]
MIETFVVDDSGIDELSHLLTGPRRTTRHDVWLWLYLDDNENAGFDPATCNGITMRDTIAGFLRKNTDKLAAINLKKDQFLIPDIYLKWIEEDERQYQWLLGRIKKITESRLPRGLVHLTGRNHLIAMLDLWNVEIGKKAGKIERLRYHWLSHKAKDRELEWFEDKKDGNKRCKCASEWLEKNPPSIFKRPPPISNYKELLMYFDEAEHGPQEQKAIIQGIKKRWSRKQFDVRAADKKQVNVMLSKATIELLDTLAKKHELKRAQILELLITTESEDGVYLTGRLKGG